MQKEVEKETALAYKAIKQVLESKKIVTDFKKQLKAKKGKEFKDILKSQDSILKSLNGLLDDMFGKEDKRQGITATKEPSNISYLFVANRYISSLQTEPGRTENTLLKNANAKVGTVIDKINSFFKTEWPAYRTKMEALKLSPFKDAKEIK